MSGVELQSLLADWHSLIPEARSALAAEFASRNLDFELPTLEEDAPPDFRELVTIRSYRDLSEAIVARAVIESAGIFCFYKRREPRPPRLAGVELHRGHSPSGCSFRCRSWSSLALTTHPE